MILAKADVNKLELPENFSPLHQIAIKIWQFNEERHTNRNISSQREVYNIFKILLENGANVNKQDPAGRTCLHFIGEHIHFLYNYYLPEEASESTPYIVKIIRLLVKYNVDTSITNEHNETAQTVAFQEYIITKSRKRLDGMWRVLYDMLS